MKPTRIILLAMLISFGLNTMAQVAINNDGSDPNSTSILHVKGNSTKKHIVIEPGATGGVGIGITIPNTFLHINSGSDQDPFRVQINGYSKLFTLNNGGTGIGNFTETLPANGLYVYGSVGIGINSPSTSAKLEISSTSQGFLPPRMSHTQMNAIASPATGLMVYNTNFKSPFFYNGSVWKQMYNNIGESGEPITYGGQTYETVIIVDQIWMAENLNYETSNSWWFNNSNANGDVYGRLYTWDAAQTACPTGWHLPTDDEWKTMEIYLGMSQSEVDATGFRGTDEGGKMKETGTTHWDYPNTGAINTSGFTALPGGWRDTDGLFGILRLHLYGYWWSGTESSGTQAWRRALYYDNDKVSRINTDKTYGFSVRCLKN